MLMLETLLNRYLALDPEVHDKLATFSGKVIQLDITGIDKTIFLFPEHSGIHIDTHYDGHADTVLRGGPGALFRMGLVSDVSKLLLKGEVEINGDTRLGHQFKNILSKMDIDWSEPLAKLVGEAAASQLVENGKAVSRWGRESTRSVAQSVSEYLTEESRDVISGAELSLFNDAVDAIRDDVDRLQARIDTLKDNHKK